MDLKDRKLLIGQRIKKMRSKAGLTQPQLAKELSNGLETERGKSTISEYEHGKNLNLDNIHRIAEVLNAHVQCDENYLLGCQEHPDITTSWIAEQIPLSEDAIMALINLNELTKMKKPFTYVDSYGGGMDEDANVIAGLIDWLIRGLCWRIDDSSLLEDLCDLKEAIMFRRDYIDDDNSIHGDIRAAQAASMAISNARSEIGRTFGLFAEEFINDYIKRNSEKEEA